MTPEEQSMTQNLLDYIEKQTAQIKALKKALKEEKTQNLSWENWSSGGDGMRVYPGREKMFPMAKKQLSSDDRLKAAGVTWDDTE